MTKKTVVLWNALLFAVSWELEIEVADLPFIISRNSFLSWAATLSNQNSSLTFQISSLWSILKYMLIFFLPFSVPLLFLLYLILWWNVQNLRLVLCFRFIQWHFDIFHVCFSFLIQLHSLFGLLFFWGPHGTLNRCLCLAIHSNTMQVFSAYK